MSVAVLRRSHAGSLRGLRDDGRRVGAERAQRRPVHEVQPQLAVVAPRQVVVAEEVRVGDDHDAALLVRRRDDQSGAGRVGGRARAQHDAVGVVGGQRTGAVEARLLHAEQDAGVGRSGRGLADDPGRHAVAGVELEDDRVLETDAERREQIVEVAAVLVLFFLTEHDEAAARGHEGLDGGDLGGREHRCVPAHGALPFGVAGMGDHEQIRTREGYFIERPAGGRGDREVTRGELGGGAGVRGRGGV